MSLPNLTGEGEVPVQCHNEVEDGSGDLLVCFSYIEVGWKGLLSLLEGQNNWCSVDDKQYWPYRDP